MAPVLDVVELNELVADNPPRMGKLTRRVSCPPESRLI